MISRRRCPQCNKAVGRSASWCPSCGAELPQQEAVLLAPESVAAPAEVARSTSAPAATGTPTLVIGPVEEPRARTRELSYVLAGLLVLSLVAVGFVIRSLAVTTTASDGQQTSAVSRAAVLTRASAISQQAFVYSATTVSSDVARAATNMTPAMAARYTALLTDQVRSDIASRGQNQKANVAGAAMISLTNDTARVLELLVQQTTVAGSSNEQDNAERLVVTLKKVNGVWLIDGMDPF